MRYLNLELGAPRPLQARIMSIGVCAVQKGSRGPHTPCISTKAREHGPNKKTKEKTKEKQKVPESRGKPVASRKGSNSL